jgi:hypothetical protein
MDESEAYASVLPGKLRLKGGFNASEILSHVVKYSHASTPAQEEQVVDDHSDDHSADAEEQSSLGRNEPQMTAAERQQFERMRAQQLSAGESKSYRTRVDEFNARIEKQREHNDLK